MAKLRGKPPIWRGGTAHRTSLDTEPSAKLKPTNEQILADGDVLCSECDSHADAEARCAYLLCHLRDGAVVCKACVCSEE